MENQNDRCIELCQRVVTTESFIEEAKAIYGDKYDYSKVVYKNRENKVVVCCPVHGDFDVYAREHLDGKGCPKCAKGEKFVAKLREKFGDKFGLDNFVYESSTQPVELICPTHGSFFGLTNTILYSKCGCPECAKDLKVEVQNQKALEKELKKEEKRLLKQTKVSHVEDNHVRKCEEGCAVHQLTEQNLRSEIEKAKSDCSIDLEKAKIYIFPYYSIDFFISDKFGVRQMTLYRMIPNNWFSIPFVDDFDYHEIRRLCRNFAQNKPMVYYGDANSNIDIPHFDLSYHCRCDKNASAEIDSTQIRNYPNSFVSIDFETLYAQRVSACSVGMVKYKDGEIVDRYYSLIRPPYDYPGKTGRALTWIHGFREEDVSGERTFAEILPEIEAFVEELPLVAHNSCVERACISETVNFYGLTTSLPYANIIDTYPLSRRIERLVGLEVEGSGTHSLDAVCRRFGVPEGNHHNALDDAEMCGNLLIEFIKILEGSAFEIKEKPKAPSKKTEKYNAEDKVQRTDLENVAENPFKDCAVVLTGFAVALSQEYGHKLKELGAKVCTGVSFKTKWLICGPNAGPSKMEKAREVGAQIISEEEFLSLIQNIE